ncbi:hypothetical protein [Algicola sagamiensis]|uniref:hypothetical protein n=1 Tax=Algicola sagamiensis TaxID=163869 RepID=UPI0012F9E875|nr:hypothetical protein [Algicola sagamiensis]
MSRILIVPTYNYLSAPLIDKVIRFFGENHQYALLTHHEHGANFGELERDVRDRFSIDIQFRQPKRQLLGDKRTQQKMLRWVENYNPIRIVTFSDITLFSRAMKGTEFEQKMLVIQPCLLNQSPMSWKQQIKRIVNWSLNLCIGAPIRNIDAFWGKGLARATYIVWGNIELEFYQQARNFIRGGLRFSALLDELKMNSDIEKQTSREIVIIAPDFNFYESQKQVDAYFAELKKLCAVSKFTVSIKYHPLNQRSLPEIPNLTVLSELPLSRIRRCSIVISGYSNLAISARCLNPNIYIFDQCKYAIPHICSPYFQFIQSLDCLIEDIDGSEDKKTRQEQDAFLQDVFFEDKHRLSELRI